MSASKSSTPKSAPSGPAWEHLSESNEHFTPMRVIEPAREVLGEIDLDPASCAEANERVRAKRFFTVRDPSHLAAWRGRVFQNPPGGMNDENFRRVIRKKGDVEGCVVTGACGLPPGHTHEGVDSSAKRWWFKLVREWIEERVEEAIFVGFSLEMLQTMQVDTPRDGGNLRPLPTPLDVPLCFPQVRVPYDKVGKDGVIVKGGSPPHASFIAYLPSRPRGNAAATKRSVHDFVKVFSALGQVVVSEGWSR